LEQIELELRRIEYTVDGNPENYPIFREYQRRCEVVRDLMEQAVTSDVAMATAVEKLDAAQMLLNELIDAGRGDVMDEMAVALYEDVVYLEGLALRLQAGITAETFVYSLADIDRL
ncbi:MAG: hypothetical protein AAGK74_20460, partial [Chloroflexota bacterium]